MGINGLLPLLKSIQKPCNLKKFAGQTIGVDAYGWLHRGTVACAIDLALGKATTKYVDFSMHRVRMLIHFGVIPYIVFDGDYLPSKAVTEVERAKRREESKKKGLELYRLNKPSQAHLELQKAVDVTPEMARQFIDELKKIGVQYVVAPYEADAQLVYLERKGVIQGMLSEDSDLLVFGAKCLMTKLDQYGDCIEINRADFTACREISLVGWSDAEFRRMAILSGCDYLASINRMGLKSAYRYVRKYKTIEKILQMLAFDGQYYIPKGYLEAFCKAELTFLHQRVFCPLKNDVVMMTELGSEAHLEDFSFVGREVEKDVAIGVSRGDLDPMTKQPLYARSSAKTTPKTPWGNPRRKMADTCTDTKAPQSIESFFKAKRTPLTELDPNSFTPSPTQERLLQQADGASWEPSPAPAGPPSLRSSRSMPQSAPRAALSTNMAQTLTNLGATLSGSNPSKRRRLCLDLDDGETLGTSMTPEMGRSPFFAANVPEPSPSMKNNAKHRKDRRDRDKDITIWSDDSIEDAMAELPDISEISNTLKRGKLEIFRDSTQEEPKDLAWTETRENDRPEEDSQSSTTSKGTETSEASTSTQATSVTNSDSSIAQTLDKHVTAELQALAATYSHQPDTEKMTSQRREIERTMEHQKPGTANQFPSKSTLLRQRSMTPLQRLGVGALNRSKSCSGLFKAEIQGAENVSVKKPSGDPHTTEAIPTLARVHSIGPDASGMKGSEDAIIPDSEDSGSDAFSETEEATKPKIDLGRFAFSG